MNIKHFGKDAEEEDVYVVHLTCEQEAQGRGAMTGVRQLEHLLSKWVETKQWTNGSSKPKISPCCTTLRATTCRPSMLLCFTSKLLDKLGYLGCLPDILAMSSLAVFRLFLV